MADQLIQLPDGSVASFPDSMSQSDIEAALAGDTSAGNRIIQQQTGIDPSAAGGFGLAKSYLQGFTLGHEPEYIGGLEHLLGAGDYSDLVARERNAMRAYQLTNPGGFGLGTTVGSTAQTALALSGAGAGARALMGLAPSTSPLVGFPTGALQGAGEGLAAGAGAGLLQADIDPRQQGWNEIGPGLAASSLLGALSPAVRNALLPEISPGVAGVAQSGDQLGVHLSLPQLVQTGRTGVRPGGSTEQLSNFTRALSRTMGGDSDVLNEPQMLSIQGHLQDQFDRLASRTSIPAGEAGLVSDLTRLDAQATSTFRGNPSALAKVQGQLDNVRDALASGIPGNVYQEMTSYSGDIARLMNDPETRLYGVRLRSAVDAAMQRNVAPGDAGLWRDLRTQWKNMVALQDVVGKAQPSGIIDPRSIDPVVRKAYKDYEFGGGGDLATLAQVGKLLPPAMATGEAKSAPSHGLLAAAKQHPLMTMGIGSVAADRLLENPGIAWQLATEHPTATAIGGTLAAGALGATAAKRAILGSEWYRRAALANALTPASSGISPWLVGPLMQGTQQAIPGLTAQGR